jgi:hypothetical protein
MTDQRERYNFKGELCANEWKVVHGHRPKTGGSETYNSWKAMHSRCRDFSNKNYGAKGIVVCERWSDFRLFLEGMGERPDGCTIDRIDPNGNYEPGNCRWATAKQQARNKRDSVKVVIGGTEMNLKDVSDMYGIPTTTIYRRHHQGLRGDELISKRNRLYLRAGSKSPNAKLSDDDVLRIKKLLNNGVRTTEIAKEFGVKQPTISDIKSGATWSHLNCTPENSESEK